MKESYLFKVNEIKNIINRFGIDFYYSALRNIETYAEQWSLYDFQFIPSYSANLVFICHSEAYGKLVLKLGNTSSREMFTEFNALCEYNGRRFCKVFEADLDNGILLEECVVPGKTLREEEDLDIRLAVFSSLYSGLHIESVNAERYPTYTGWVSRITDYMSRREDYKELYLHMKKAKDICTSISEEYSQKMLLHGDFHHDNILLGEGGSYVIIDPKGVIGDPVFDVPRFILNEFDGEFTEESYKKINYIISVLEEKLEIPNSILRACLYVETVMAQCWFVEDGAAAEEYSRMLKTVKFTERILKAYK